MRIALFAAEQVGLRIAHFLREQSAFPTCVVLDANDRRGMNDQIQTAAGSCAANTILTNRQSRAHLAQQLSEFCPDLCILAWWPYILKPDVLTVPRIGSLNFHPSLLPHGRGKSPNFWSIVEGTPFGVTIHWVDEGIDSGDLAYQQEIPICWEDSGKTLYEKALDALVTLFQEHWPEIHQGNIPRIPQDGEAVCHFQRELDDASRIDLDGTYRGRDVLNILRARTFEPHPGAWFIDGGKRYEVRVSVSQVEEKRDDARAIRRA